MTPADENNNKEWSCGTCTFLNKPLFLSCEMCGQARPSQRPCPPRRQPSLPPEDDERVDRAPRSVQRTIDISGTLIMTDDPADYETQDGKKPGEESDDEENEQDPFGRSYERRSREDDPTLDESGLETHPYMSSESARHSPHRHADYSHSSRHQHQAYPASRPSSSNYYHRHNEVGISPTERRHTYQGRDRDRDTYAAPAATARKSHHSVGSGSTLPTAYMGNSSSRLQEESNSFADDVSSLSSGGERGLYHPHRQGMNNSSRRHLGGGGRARLAAAATPQDIHYHGQSNGLPVISRNSSRLDYSSNSHYSHTSHDSSSHGRRISHQRPSLGGSSAAASMRHIPETQQAFGSSRQLGQRGVSMASLPVDNGGDFLGSVLPSLAPPPVPTMDSPGDVNAMAVFAKDQQQVAERAMSRRKMTANEARKDRGKMLDNLRGVLPMNNTSMRSLGTSSQRNVMMGAASQRGFSTRLLENTEEEEQEDNTDMDQSASNLHHPAMMQDTEALESPNTRRERHKQRRKMKGAVRTLMATMRISSGAK